MALARSRGIRSLQLKFLGNHHEYGRLYCPKMAIAVFIVLHALPGTLPLPIKRQWSQGMIM